MCKEQISPSQNPTVLVLFVMEWPSNLSPAKLSVLPQVIWGVIQMSLLFSVLACIPIPHNHFQKFLLKYLFLCHHYSGYNEIVVLKTQIVGSFERLWRNRIQLLHLTVLKCSFRLRMAILKVYVLLWPHCDFLAWRTSASVIGDLMPLLNN